MRFGAAAFSFRLHSHLSVLSPEARRPKTLEGKKYIILYGDGSHLHYKTPDAERLKPKQVLDPFLSLELSVFGRFTLVTLDLYKIAVKNAAFCCGKSRQIAVKTLCFFAANRGKNAAKRYAQV